MNEVWLPWPDKALSPNSRVHWAVKAAAVKEYRELGYALALQAGMRRDWPEGPLWVWATGFPADRRRRDSDNLFASMKGCVDGIAQAMGVDDSRFRIACWIGTEVRKPPVVRIRVTTGPEGAPQ